MAQCHTRALSGDHLGIAEFGTENENLRRVGKTLESWLMTNLPPSTEEEAERDRNLPQVVTPSHALPGADSVTIHPSSMPEVDDRPVAREDRLPERMVHPVLPSEMSVALVRPPTAATSTANPPVGRPRHESREESQRDKPHSVANRDGFVNTGKMKVGGSFTYTINRDR